VVAGASANATALAIEQSLACRDAGADGLLHVTPWYNKPTQDGLHAHFSAIAKACPLPIVLYNVPGRTGCDLLPPTIARLAEIDNIVAVKEATGCTRRATDIVQLVGNRLAVLSGDDFTAMPLYAVGARGVISVVSNVVPARMAEMWDAASAGEWARARSLHFDIQRLAAICFAEPNPIPVKAALALLGLTTDEVRSPLTPCTEPVKARLRECLAAEGLL